MSVLREVKNLRLLRRSVALKCSFSKKKSFFLGLAAPDYDVYGALGRRLAVRVLPRAETKRRVELSERLPRQEGEERSAENDFNSAAESHTVWVR